MIETENITLQKKIKEVIDYFGIFSYPISAEEIHKFVTIKIDLTSLKNELNFMVSINELKEFDNFYCASDKIKELLAQRILMNSLAEKLLQKSKLYSTLLSYFPFVKSLAITGSLSKNCANKNSDIDYFVIVETNRVWICKNLIQLFKNILRIFGKEEYMCANYFKAQNEQELEEKTKFTEMELITMLPVFGETYFKKFYNTNNWAYSKYPNLDFKTENKYYSKSNFILKYIKIILEFCFNLIGNPLDNFLMKVIKARWEKAHLKDYDSYQDFDRSIKIRKNEIKYHLNSSRLKMKKQE